MMQHSKADMPVVGDDDNDEDDDNGVQTSLEVVEEEKEGVALKLAKSEVSSVDNNKRSKEKNDESKTTATTTTTGVDRSLSSSRMTSSDTVHSDNNSSKVKNKSANRNPVEDKKNIRQQQEQQQQVASHQQDQNVPSSSSSLHTYSSLTVLPTPRNSNPPLSEARLHEMALSLFLAPSWRTRRRRKQSLTACATDLGQRLQQASVDLLDTLCQYLEQSQQHSSSNPNSSSTVPPCAVAAAGLTLPVTALSWLLYLFQTTTTTTNTTTTTENRNAIESSTSTSYEHVLLRHHFYKTPVRAPIRRALQRLCQLLQRLEQNPQQQQQNSGLAHLRVTGSFLAPKNNTLSSSSSTTTNTISSTSVTAWPQTCTHRDLTWPELSSSSSAAAAGSTTRTRASSAITPTATLSPAQQWMQAYIQWQTQPRLSVVASSPTTTTTKGDGPTDYNNNKDSQSLLLPPPPPPSQTHWLFLSHLTVLWLDQVPSSCFDASTGLLPLLAPHLKVLRIERTSLEECCFFVRKQDEEDEAMSCNDIFQQPQHQEQEQEALLNHTFSTTTTTTTGPSSASSSSYEHDPLAPPTAQSSSGSTEAVSSSSRRRPSRTTLYPHLTHLKITHCALPWYCGLVGRGESDIREQKKKTKMFPIWSHFPALQSLSLSHNSIGGTTTTVAPPPTQRSRQGRRQRHGQEQDDDGTRPTTTTRRNPTMLTTLLQGLSVLTNLQRLDLSHNSISCGLQQVYYHVGNLSELNVSHNALTSCVGLDRLYSLERLYLHENQLSDLASIRGLACLPQLTFLTLYGNPLSQMNTKRRTQLVSSQSDRAANNKQPSMTINGTAKPNTSSLLNGDAVSSSKSKMLYRLAVLDLFWQARQSSSSNINNMGDEQGFVLDQESVSQGERDALRSMAFGTKLAAPEYHRPQPRELPSTHEEAASSTSSPMVPLEAPGTAGGVSPLSSSSSYPSLAKTSVGTNQRRRRRRPVAVLEPTTSNRWQKVSKQRHLHRSSTPSKDHSTADDTTQTTIVQPPLLKFDAADILQSLCAPTLLPPPPPPIENKMMQNANDNTREQSSDDDLKHDQGSTDIAEVVEAEKAPIEYLPTDGQTTSDSREKAAQSSSVVSTLARRNEERVVSMAISSTATAASHAPNNPQEEREAATSHKTVSKIERTSLVGNNIEDGDTSNLAQTSAAAIAAPLANSGLSNNGAVMIPESKEGLDDHAGKSNQEALGDDDDKVSLDKLPISPIPKEKGKMGTVPLYNSDHSSPTKNASSVISDGGEGSVSQLGDVSTLNSTMLLSFPSTREQLQQHQLWRTSDDGSSAPGSVSNSQMDDQTKFVLAEKNSSFIGPHTYKQFTIHDNLEIYFRMFVFSTATGISTSNTIFFDPEECIWQHVLENFPRIQLWPLDRRVQEADAAKAIGPTGPSAKEEFRRVWRESVVGCGKPALKRITPVRCPRLGFHGDMIYPSSSSTLEVMAGATTSSSSLGRPEAVTKERKTVLCASTVAFYVIIDHDRDDPRNLGQGNAGKSFPKPIPMDACFAEAIWPHALARHPWTHLRAITIGFNFQRLTLRFRQSTHTGGTHPPKQKIANEEDEFCYILLTCNKLETVGLLKEFQDLTDNIAVAVDSPGSGSGVVIENDDPFVLDGLGRIVNNVLGAICHFQILHQYWKSGDRGHVRRLCVVTDSRLYLFDENYCGDGSKENDTARSKVGEWGIPQYSKVDEADLGQVISVQAATSDPRLLTISISPTSRLFRTHNWRLICRDREGAERLIDDVRKAVRTAEN